MGIRETGLCKKHYVYYDPDETCYKCNDEVLGTFVGLEIASRGCNRCSCYDDVMYRVESTINGGKEVEYLCEYHARELLKTLGPKGKAAWLKEISE